MAGTIEQMPPPEEDLLKGRTAARLVCWLLGNGCLFGWNSLMAIEDYNEAIFEKYHPEHTLALVYLPFALVTIFCFTHFEALINTRLRILAGYALFFLCLILLPIVNLATHGRGGMGSFIVTCILIAGFGIADSHVQGGLFGEVSFMGASYIQAFAAGLAASGAISAGLRLVCKAAFPETNEGLRQGALLFFFMAACFQLICIFLYACVLPHLDCVKYYRSKAAAEGSLTVFADLATAGVYSSVYLDKDQEKKPDEQQGRLTNSQLIGRNADYCFVLCFCYALTYSIFPQVLAKQSKSERLTTWYEITKIVIFNVGDLLGRYFILIDQLRLKSRPGLISTALIRLAFIPALYFTSRHGPPGWMVVLTLLFGITHGYLTVCVFVNAPEGYLGAEQNALGNILVLFLVLGFFVGVVINILIFNR